MPLVPPPRPAAQPAADIPPTSVLNANQPEGVYEATFDVTANYL